MTDFLFPRISIFLGTQQNFFLTHNINPISEFNSYMNVCVFVSQNICDKTGRISETQIRKKIGDITDNYEYQNNVIRMFDIFQKTYSNKKYLSNILITSFKSSLRK